MMTSTTPQQIAHHLGAARSWRVTTDRYQGACAEVVVPGAPVSIAGSTLVIVHEQPENRSMTTPAVHGDSDTRSARVPHFVVSIDGDIATVHGARMPSSIPVTTGASVEQIREALAECARGEKPVTKSVAGGSQRRVGRSYPRNCIRCGGPMSVMGPGMYTCGEC